ncbi:enolase [Halorubrum sp. BV1]|uniref:enolase n=1 Tax=Halorubrum sp. BV1 TaxID=1498500 RepID=UPI0006792336|nr:enolase [Halorubrum sp. BV1]
MHVYERIAGLTVTIESVGRRQYVSDTTSGFERTTTEFRLTGDGVVGRGEDVTYETDDHDALAGSDPIDLEGEWTIAELSAHLDDVDLFAARPPTREIFRHYRRWAVESAALDLALRQRGESLGEFLGIEPDPVRFVVSTRLGDPPTTDRVEELLALDADLEFKLDPTPKWSDGVFVALRETNAVRILDLKGWYEGTDVDVDADPELYRDVFAAFPTAVVEDPAVTPETRALVEPQADRLSFDYPVDGVESLRGLPVEPGWCNVKPSRFGTLESLFETIDYCLENDIRLYGGGQFELASGRTAIQTLAALFYPDAPNDVAPGAFNDPASSPPYPTSPLAPRSDAVGLEF